SLTAGWGGFGGVKTVHWKDRQRSTQQMYGGGFGKGSRGPGGQGLPRPDPPPPGPAQDGVGVRIQGGPPPERMQEVVEAVRAAGNQSGMFMYVETDLKFDLPEARVVIDRDRLADLGLDLAGVGQELGTLLGGGYVNHFNYYDRSYKVIPQIGDADRASLGPLLDLKVKTPSGQLVPV